MSAGIAIAIGVLAFACSLRSDGPTGPQSAERSSTVTVGGNSLVSDVATSAQPLPGNPAPRYPDVLRSANIEGDVLAQFVVDTTGTPIASTFKVLQSSHPLFTKAVESGLATLKFSPAVVSGKKVKQLIQMPFEFNLGG
jgi:TonB family protein